MLYLELQTLGTLSGFFLHIYKTMQTHDESVPDRFRDGTTTGGTATGGRRGGSGDRPIIVLCFC